MMIPFTVISLHLSLASIRLVTTLVPTGLAIVLLTIAPVSETRTILSPATGAIIDLWVGFCPGYLPVLTSCTHSLATCGTGLKFGSD